MLPGLDGVEVCRQVHQHAPVPVLMLTARTDETDMLVGLGVGAMVRRSSRALAGRSGTRPGSAANSDVPKDHDHYRAAMTARRIHYVDVFTATPLLGNPVAVVLDGDGLSTDTMQAVARWTNLSETTFVVPTDRADYGLRIFTPVSELPFAGHPTVGSAHAVLETGLVTGPTVVQDCTAGLVPIQQDGDGRIRAVTPRTDTTDRPVDRAAVAAALGIDLGDLSDPVVIDAGPFWLVARLPSSAVVDGLRPDLPAIAALSQDDPSLTGITVYGHDDGERVTVRSFAPAVAVDEDPVCGSGNAAVGRHRALTEGRSTGYTAHQGTAVHRDGRVAVDYEGDQVTIGGNAVTTVRGTLHEL